MGATEINRASAYLSIGYFKAYQGIKRETCFVICFELTEQVIKLEYRQRCETYHSGQPIFQAEPSLADHIRRKDSGNYDNELIDITAIQQIGDTEIAKYRDHYFLIDYCLNPSALGWVKANFPDHPLFIRLKPHKVFDKQPPGRLFESILMPANPNWWKNLNIHNRDKEGAAYQLGEDEYPDNPQALWEYKIKNINRLEVIAKRDNNGNLSMMLEELTGMDHNNMVFGRCIHLDTDDKQGTSAEDAVLNHLDLAINVYEDDNGKKRLTENLAHGQVTSNASYRTHLLRIENVPFKSLVVFALLFFKSQTLFQEWFEDQFTK
ncbi:hypothetical protein ACQ86K_01120 [Mucilaginibacter sp. P19]|uniref:hypothetical protein n=1 Tax=Mucilaginibacter sp. P19 TaxID=3423947 RepID=UPI003D66BE81